MSEIIGLDVGGTKLAVGRVNVETGALLSLHVTPTDAERPADEVLATCLDLAMGQLEADTAAIGVGVCELVGLDGTITSGHTIDWRNTDVAAAFGRLVPCSIESDVRAAAIAEAWFGAGRGHDSFMYVSIGTGVSYSLVEHGLVRRGHRGNALVVGAPMVELRAGGRALIDAVGADRLDTVFDDPATAPTIESMATEIGVAIATLINALDPELVIIGGGLGTHRRFLASVERAARDVIYALDTQRLPIVAGELAGTAGVVGAAVAAGIRLGLLHTEGEVGSPC